MMHISLWYASTRYDYRIGVYVYTRTQTVLGPVLCCQVDHWVQNKFCGSKYPPMIAHSLFWET